MKTTDYFSIYNAKCCLSLQKICLLKCDDERWRSVSMSYNSEEDDVKTTLDRLSGRIMKTVIVSIHLPGIPTVRMPTHRFKTSAERGELLGGPTRKRS